MLLQDKNKKLDLNINKKKPAQILSWLLAIFMLLIPNISNAQAYKDISGTTTYYGSEGFKNLYDYSNLTDIGNSENKEAIYEMAMMNIMGGFSDKTFRPSENLTQSQAQAIANKIQGKATPQNTQQTQNQTQAKNQKEPEITKSAFMDLMDKTLKTKTSKERVEGLELPITRENAAKMLFENIDKIQALKGISVIKGEVVDLKNVDDMGKRSKSIYNRTPEGAYFNAVINGSQNFPLYREGQISESADSIYVGENVNYFLKDNKIIYAKIDKLQNEYTLEGKFEGIQGANVVFRDLNNNLKIYPYSPGIKVYLNETKMIPKEDLQYGQEIVVNLKNNLVQQINGFLEEDPDRDGYIYPESKMIAGSVNKVGSNYISLNDNKGNYTVLSTTKILNDGKTSDLKSIKEGDLVKLYMDNIYTKEVSKVEIEGEERQVSQVVKATIDSYDGRNQEIIVKAPKKLNGWTWESLDSDYGKYKVDGSVYFRGKSLTPDEIKGYKGSEIYMAVSNGYGSGNILKANIKSGFAFNFDDDISRINQSNSYIDIDNNVINYDEGTLVVKNDRIVGSSNLEKDINAFVEGSVKPNKQANIIVLGKGVNTNKYGFKIYRGTLENVYDYAIDIGRDDDTRRIHIFENNTWNEDRETKIKVGISDDTRVYDTDNGKEVSIETIRNARYDRDSNALKSPYLYRPIYVVEKDGMVYGINFLKSGSMAEIKRQNATYGKVTEASETSLTIGEIREWNALSEKWVQETDKDSVNIKSAMVFLGDKYLKSSEYTDLVGKRVMILYEKKTSKTDDAIVVIGE